VREISARKQTCCGIEKKIANKILLIQCISFNAYVKVYKNVDYAYIYSLIIYSCFIDWIPVLKRQLAEATERGDAEAVHHILMSGAVEPDVSVNREGFDKSPLILACTYGQTPVVEELLRVCVVCLISCLFD
jgi:hypothetical protein